MENHLIFACILFNCFSNFRSNLLQNPLHFQLQVWPTKLFPKFSNFGETFFCGPKYKSCTPQEMTGERIWVKINRPGRPNKEREPQNTPSILSSQSQRRIGCGLSAGLPTSSGQALCSIFAPCLAQEPRAPDGRSCLPPPFSFSLDSLCVY